ncbi:hypothetical protein H6F74_25675 [Trichocoleus sp. FACHB-90]|uniref:hypothetical protein n=1 Tax=Cyanophyceae TaxID=3028117 RepID=UPI0016849154|nr:hypothetical protein [Trichocoleus sp. FACHB-90]MBD1929604.1 hypothetical protein [Trichocoleus sp. FACHB-90]
MLQKNVKTSGLAQGLWKVKGAIALGFLALVLPACGTPEREATVPSPTAPVTAPDAANAPVTAPDAGNTSVETVVEDTRKLIGQTVTVSGEVEEIVGAKAFQMEDEKIFNNDKVLVINATPAAVPITEGKDVRVTGVVREFVLAEFEKDYDLTWDLNLKQKIEAEYKNKPVIVAQTTQVIE